MAFRAVLPLALPKFSRVGPSTKRLLFGAAVCFSAGCEPQIGDDCQTSVDCSQSGERLCDITQPGGYCTIFSCASDSCPGDSVCVAFDTELSAVTACANANGVSRFARSACMARCDSDSDCRGGYDCIAVGAPGNPWSAVVVEGRASAKVCIVPLVADPVPADRGGEVCQAVDADGGASSMDGSAGRGD